MALAGGSVSRSAQVGQNRTMAEKGSSARPTRTSHRSGRIQGLLLILGDKPTGPPTVENGGFGIIWVFSC